MALPGLRMKEDHCNGERMALPVTEVIWIDPEPPALICLLREPRLAAFDLECKKAPRCHILVYYFNLSVDAEVVCRLLSEYPIQFTLHR